MTTEDAPGDATGAAQEANLDKMTANLARVEELSQRLIQALSSRKPPNTQLNGPDAELFTRAATSYWSEMMQNPARLFEAQVEYWGQSVKHFMEAQQALVGGEPQEEDGPEDRRFSNPLWKTHPYFNLVKRQYQLNAEAIRKAVEEAEDLDDKDRRRLNYFARQIVDMLSPTNFLGTNPDALEKAVATEGESLVRGLENLVADLEANDGEMLVRLADDSAFELGRNVGASEGSVVYRNRMFELIQYAPTTDEVHATPLLIFPPWINKFYIMDLKPENSLIKWITEQGYTLFVVSWVNPGPEYRDVGMDTYVEEGFLEAIRVVREITGQKQVNAVGYCIGGTTLNLTLALMKHRGDKSVKSATFFTALTDFGDQGEFTPFLQDDFVEGIEAEVEEFGVLRSFIMSRTMSFLRSKDLIYGPAVRSYMMGETPPAFDLLFWNGDGTNLPARMTMEYLRWLCQQNRFATEGVELCGERLHVGDVEVPVCAVSCETDHIAPWKDCYRGVQQMGAKQKTFIVSQSGHIAGIINPPSKKKYGHYTNTSLSGDASAWMEKAKFHEGSWWPRWEKWLRRRSGKMVPARIPGDSGYPELCPAPGTYVVNKPSV
ncbi:class I poly(R)-hydroxyalkanoic acid synthase [Aquicoccus porphyridii]|uniref:Class I poly(R)-hydroxyalkanoic acid synthase n=1 Tax=Aquicoccus porphyridii TaxID=1852029 RepID=A0A5A9ZTD1_9RHOB|nr:class I poly(R)-hydroxyalkanoic acid synthase [Aquicoccus porphyridii]KAA0920613.1 class I poly(R)-hydroxyalkanoic acid synthase [Aquicoccus porphyridii]RAI56828.1 class I poly(R)-hydroxyalkanoic acid synthase [Rhodobacteraceae bacterium AsT-22]